MAYSEKLIDHYENPRNVGSFDKSDTDVGTGMVGAPACGDVMKLQIKVGKEGYQFFLKLAADDSEYEVAYGKRNKNRWCWALKEDICHCSLPRTWVQAL